jgi:DNA-binding transcriptional LysR family regulator
VVVAVAADSPLPKRVKLSDLAGMPWVINPDGCGFRGQLERALAGSGLMLDVIVESWGVAMQLALIAAGVGIGLIPERALTDSPYRGRIRAVTIPDFAAALAIWMVTSGELGPLEEAVGVVAETVRRLLAGPATGRRAANGRVQRGKRA